MLLVKIALLRAAHVERWSLLIKLKSQLAEAQRHERLLQQAKVTALGAAQAISREMSPDKVLEQILRIVVSEVEAQRGVLITAPGEATCRGAALKIENETCFFDAIQNGVVSGGIPNGIVEHVTRTGETVRMTEHAPDVRFSADSYFAMQHPRSLFALALGNRGWLVGILYLENFSDSNAFTQDRVELLSILSAQAATALENAQLFPEAQAMSERLRQAHAELMQQATEQLSIAEKRWKNELMQRTRSEEERTALQEQMIQTQSQRLAEMSTPLIPITDSIVVMPLVGSMDTARADQVLQTALQGAQARRARIVIIDITGMKQVDSHAASSLINTASALRLLGTETLITGIRAEVAQTLIGLGIDLAAIRTRSTLQSGIAYALGNLEGTKGQKGRTDWGKKIA